LAVGAVIGFVYYQQNKYEAKADGPKTDKVVRARIEEKITGSGKVDVRNGLYYVVSETAGKIAKVMPDLVMGKRVKKDDVLVQLDDTMAQYRLKEAQSALTAAQADVERAQAKKAANVAQVNSIQKELAYQRQKLRQAEEKKDSIPPGEMDIYRKEFAKHEASAEAADSLVKEAEATITAAAGVATKAEAALNLARQGLEQLNIKAPSDGIVLSVNKLLRDGQLIIQGIQPNREPLLIIAENLDAWEVNAQISEQDIGRLQNRIRKGSAVPARFSVEAYTMDKIRFTGRVATIAELPTTAQRSGLGGLEALQMGMLGGGGGGGSGPSSYTVTINVDPIRDEALRKNHPLKVGFVATDLQIIVEEFNDVVCVPALALSFKPDGLSEARQAEIAKHEDEGWTPIWFYNGANGQYSEKYIRAGASAEQLTHVREVMNGKPEDLLNQAVVVEGPKRTEKSSLFGDGKTFKIPG